MERISVTVSSEDTDYFDRERTELGMNRSAFIRFLIAEHKNTVPDFLSYKEIIQVFSEFNVWIKAIMAGDGFSDIEKLYLHEKLYEIADVIKSKMK